MFYGSNFVVKIGTSATQPQTAGSLPSPPGRNPVNCVGRATSDFGFLWSSWLAARLGLTERPRTIALKQAVAAVYQLIRVYDDLFTPATANRPSLTRSDLCGSRYVNA